MPPPTLSGPAPSGAPQNSPILRGWNEHRRRGRVLFSFLCWALGTLRECPANGRPAGLWVGSDCPLSALAALLAGPALNRQIIAPR
jgi:hypothetical protein